MPTYYARAAGNVNAAIWATTPTGTASNLFSSFTNADTLMANNFVVTLNANTTVLEIRNDTTGGATAGGRFDLTAGVTLTANVFGGTTNNATCLTYSVLGTATIIGNIKGGASAGQTNGNGVVFSGASGSILNITGNVTGGDSIGANCMGLVQSGTGTLNIMGTVTGGTTNQNHGISASAGTINITGNVIGTTGSSVGLTSSNANVNIIGNIIAGFGNSSSGASFSGSGSINITGNVTGGSAQNAFGINASHTNIMNITGNVTGGSNSASFGSIGVMVQAGGTVKITGTCTAGTAGGAQGCGAVINSTNGVINIIGTAVGGANAAGATIWLGQNGTLTATRAKGNGFGNGSAGLTSQPGVAGLQTGLCRVYEIEYGDLGQSPTSGPVFLFPSTSNVALFYRFGTTKKTLVDATSSSGLLPNNSDVRSGISYNAGNNVGTMAIPAAASVALGVSVDNTIGTAILTTGNIADIWNYPTSGISVSNSIGERLKNCSTVATMGQQLATSVSNIN